MVWVDPSGLTDYFGILEADIATPWGGIDASAGFVVDTDNLWHSGFFSTGGPAHGLSGGLGIGGGFVGEIEGFAQTLDANVGAVSFANFCAASDPGDRWDELTPVTGLAVTVGEGAGVAVSETQTDTATVEHLWGRTKHYGRRAVGAVRSGGRRAAGALRLAGRRIRGWFGR